MEVFELQCRGLASRDGSAHVDGASSVRDARLLVSLVEPAGIMGWPILVKICFPVVDHVRCKTKGGMMISCDLLHSFGWKVNNLSICRLYRPFLSCSTFSLCAVEVSAVVKVRLYTENC